MPHTHTHARTHAPDTFSYFIDFRLSIDRWPLHYQLATLATAAGRRLYPTLPGAPQLTAYNLLGQLMLLQERVSICNLLLLHLWQLLVGTSRYLSINIYI